MTRTATVLAIAALAAAVPAAHANPHIRLLRNTHADTHALTPQPGQVAVLADSRTDAVTVALALGLPDASVRSLAYPGVHLIDTRHVHEHRDAETEELVDAAHAATQGLDAFVAPVFRGSDTGPVIPTRRIILRLAPHARRPTAEHRTPRTIGEREHLDAALSELGIQAISIEPTPGLPGAFRIETRARHALDVLEHANAIAQHTDMVYAEPVMIFTGAPAGDPALDDGSAWAIRNSGQTIFQTPGQPGIDLSVIPAWTTHDGGGVQVAVYDVGVDPDHPDINQLPGADTTPQEGQGQPINSCDNHGTPVAGCISAIRDNGLGTLGSAPGAVTRSVRVFIANKPCGTGWTSSTTETVDALLWTQQQGIRVSNNSNRYGFLASAAITDTYRETFDAGVVHVASAGNSGQPTLEYPADIGVVLGVGAIDNAGIKPTWSHFGPRLALVAPGVGIYLTDRSGPAGVDPGDFFWASGTSFSGPYVAGVAALVLDANPDLDARQVRTILFQTARDLGEPGRDDLYGRGLPDAHAAVTLARALACEPDFNNDGVLDNADIQAFVNAYLAGDPSADLNTDGTLDTADITDFVQSFLAGC